jgi:hypothetical protein
MSPRPSMSSLLHIEENSQAPQLRASSSCVQTKAKIAVASWTPINHE